jgi:GTP-binding protein EngB required for normal cell division
MNEEVTLAIDELRLRPTDRSWFIPIRLDNSSIPVRPIGGGETLSDIQWVDLWADWDHGIQELTYILLPRNSGDSELFDEAFKELSQNIAALGSPPTKTGTFTMAFAGHLGVGKSSILNCLLGEYMRPSSWTVTYTSRIVTYDWPSVGRVADIPPLGYGFSKPSDDPSEFIKTNADLLVFIITGSSRIYKGDVEGFSVLGDHQTPALIVLNGIDRQTFDQQTQTIRYVKNAIGCPLVKISALFQLNTYLLQQILRRTATLFK